MKVGIITFIDTTNYGALLQGFALCKLITQLGFEAKVINCRFQDFKRDYYVTPKFSPRFLLSPSDMARYIRYILHLAISKRQDIDKVVTVI